MKQVYFIRPKGRRGPVKIGCSWMPNLRLNQMSSWAPFPLEIAATIPGDEALERRFHHLFRDLNTHGEWFTASHELSAVIEAVAAGAFDIATLPPPKKLGSQQRTDAQRAKHSLASRYRWAADGIGLVPPEAVRAARRRVSGWGVPADPNPEDVAMVEAYIADPVGFGAVVGSSAWDQKHHTAHLDRLAAKARAAHPQGAAA